MHDIDWQQLSQDRYLEVDHDTICCAGDSCSEQDFLLRTDLDQLELLDQPPTQVDHVVHQVSRCVQPPHRTVRSLLTYLPCRLGIQQSYFDPQ